MPITTIVEFFWGSKTTYTKVVLHPDDTIEFPEYDIEEDIIAAELGDEPTQQYELYEAYSSYGILGFALEGKESYFWDSDYYLLDKNSREKRKWAKHLCRHLYDYLYSDDDLQYEDERMYAVKLVHHFSDSFEIRPEGCSLDSEFAGPKKALFICGFSFYINKTKCFEFFDYIIGHYDTKDDPGKSIITWNVSGAGITQGNAELNIREFIGGLVDDPGLGPKWAWMYMEKMPQPYQFQPEFSKYNPLAGFGKNARYGLVVIENEDKIAFKGAYQTMEQLENSLAYIYKWIDLVEPHASLYEKADRFAKEFNCYREEDESGNATIRPEHGWVRLGMA